MNAQPDTPPYQLPPVHRLSLFLEICIVVVAALAVTWPLSHTDSTQRLAGSEEEWLTSTVQEAALNLQRNGYIPLWQPWTEFGEPLVDNPFSFLLNPVVSVPTLLYGGVTGIKISVVFTALIVGLGGWALGRMLRFGWLGRLVLALFCLGKGNMFATIGLGHFQLGAAQAYFPWILAGFIGVVYLRQCRWPLVLTAIAFTLMFWTGNVWFTLPMLVLLALLTLTHIFRYLRFQNNALCMGFDLLVVRRVVICAGLTLGLSMILLLPLWATRDQIGHPVDLAAGDVVNAANVLQSFFSAAPTLIPPVAWAQYYFSFILPLWFGLLLFVILPSVPRLRQVNMPKNWRLWLAVIVEIAFCIMWGIGQTPFFIFLYQTIPLLAQWRFEGRALAVASFGIAIVIAARVDSLWHELVVTPVWQSWLQKRQPGWVPLVRAAAAFGLILICATASWQLNAEWLNPRWINTVEIDRFDDACITWLRQQYPDMQLSVDSPDTGYYNFYTYLNNNVRLYNLGAAYHPASVPPTLYHHDLIQASLPPFGLAWNDSSRTLFMKNGYQNLIDSPNPTNGVHCLWYKPDALGYAYIIPLSTLQTLDQNAAPITVSNTGIVWPINRYPDRINMTVNGVADEPLVVTIQELAYPGWTVEVDGTPARLESVGGQLGVVLSAGDKSHTIDFSYQPSSLLTGAFVTLITWLFCVLFLLKVDRWVSATFGHRLAKKRKGEL